MLDVDLCDKLHAESLVMEACVEALRSPDSEDHFQGIAQQWDRMRATINEVLAPVDKVE